VPLDPINPIGPRPAAQPGQIPGVRRVDAATDKRERDGAPSQERRRRTSGRAGAELPAPPDVGRPHVDVRV
jgi:hypothetical protein